MFKLIKSHSTLIRNCLVVYVMTGFLAYFLAESHRSFQQSIQSDNAYTFSRFMSLSLAYSAKETFDK